jgi:hypothetical protein
MFHFGNYFNSDRIKLDKRSLIKYDLGSEKGENNTFNKVSEIVLKQKI